MVVGRIVSTILRIVAPCCFTCSAVAGPRPAFLPANFSSERRAGRAPTAPAQPRIPASCQRTEAA
jgi:hypothetical protein